jgi:cytochrome c oxidase subunit 1
MSERLGRWNFWLAFFGFNIAFFPMHILGLWGMPRRIYAYPVEMGWEKLNMLATAGAMVFFLSFAVFVLNVITSLRSGTLAGNNPWNAGTLEWATASPPPVYNFARIPVVTHREPLWAERDALPVATGLAIGRRELIISTVAEARADLRETSPEPSIWPLLTALVTGAIFIASIFTPWAVVWGAPALGVAITGWFWPKGVPEDE